MNFARYGFTEIPSEVQKHVAKHVTLLLRNAVTNALYVTRACNCKTLKGSHFEAVQNILKFYLNKQRKSGVQKGGSILPIGIQSGAYFNEVGSHSPIEASGGDTRGELVSTFPSAILAQAGGAPRVSTAVTTGFVTPSTVKKMLKDLKLNVRVSKDAVDVLVASINATMDTLMQKARIMAKDNRALSHAVYLRAAAQIKHLKKL